MTSVGLAQARPNYNHGCGMIIMLSVVVGLAYTQLCMFTHVQCYLHVVSFNHSFELSGVVMRILLYTSSTDKHSCWVTMVVMVSCAQLSTHGVFVALVQKQTI